MKGTSAKVTGSRRLREAGRPLAAVLLAGCLAYSGSVQGKFVYDDQNVILANPHIRQMWPPGRFLSDSRPITSVTFALNYALDGFDPRGYHAVNLIIHLVAALTLYGLVRRTLLSERLAGRFAGSARLIALAVSVLWVVHPLTTEAVTYVVQRSESLASLFYLLTLYCIIRGAARNRAVWYFAAVMACALGMASKAVVVTAPLVAFLYDVFFVSGSVRASVQRRWPLFLALAATLVIPWRLGVFGGLYMKEPGIPSTVGFAMEGLTARQYALTQPGVVLHYLRLCIWPGPLCIDYGWPVATTADRIVPPLLALSALMVLTVWALVRMPALGFVAASFFIILAPTSSIVPIKDIAVEHRMYLPLAAVLVILIFAARAMFTQWSANDRLRRVASCCVLLLVAVSLALATHRRNALYAEPLLLWNQTVAQAPENPRAHLALGLARFESGRPQEAIAAFEQAIALDRDYAGAYANIATILWARRDASAALPYFARAVEISPDEFGADVYGNYGAALKSVGRLDEAVAVLTRAVALDPDSVPTRYNLGNALLAGRRWEEAVAAYRHALDRDPKYGTAYVNLGVALSALGRNEEALAAYRVALLVAAQPGADHAFDAHYNSGLLLAKMGRADLARQELSAALNIKPAHEGARSAMASLPRE
jgi:tetratricopeptide (TPR) repeat protein